MPTQVVVASGVVQQVVAATLVETARAVVLTTAHPVAISVTSSPASSSALSSLALMHAKKVAVSKPLAVIIGGVTALNNALHRPIRGTVAIAAVHHVKTLGPKVPVKALVAGKSVAVTTAMLPAQHLAALQGTNLHGVQNHSAQAPSNRMLQAKALLANAAAPAC